MYRSSAVAVLFASLIVAWGWAQAPGSVSGVVLDPSHARLARAVVRLLSAEGIEIGHTLTDQQGRFSFRQSCETGCFVEIQLSGFQSKKLRTPLEQREIELSLAPVRENVVVTASRTETPTSQVGSTVTTITQEEISERQKLMVSDLLQSVPGVTVARSGGLGATTSLFVRGGESDHTKVLLDGIPLNQPGGAFEFSSLAATALDHVEFVRGPQSALFGSDAMTGVVQFFSRRGSAEDRRPHLGLNFEAGKYNTLDGGADVSGMFRNFDYDLFWSRLDTDNQSVNDDFRDSTGGTNLGLSVGEHTKLRWIARGDSSRVGTPGQVAFQRPDRDAFFRKADGYTGVSLSNQTTGTWEQRLTYTFARSRQVSRDLIADSPYVPSFQGHTSPFTFFDFPSDFLNDSRRHHVDYQSDVTLGSGDRHWGQHIFTFAVNFDRELGFIVDRLSGAQAIDALRDNFGGTFQYQAVLGRIFLSNGFRVEDNGSFGRTVIPRSSAALLLRQGAGGLGATKLKFNFGLGIKEPSFIESFSPELSFLGNPNLRPERTRSFDFGIEQRLWSDRAKIELNWFDNRFRDLIEFETVSFEPFRGTFFNLDGSKANGTEVTVEAAPVNGLRLTAQYTFLNGQVTRSSAPTDPIFGEGQGLLRRPRHSGSLGIFWNWRRLTLSSTAVYVGHRVDSDFASLVPPITSSEPHTKWDLAWAVRVSKGLSYVGVAENLLDQHYMETLGFPALRIGYRTGVRFVF
jgi:vitamin B12 transporter